MVDFENELYAFVRAQVDKQFKGLNWTTVPEPIPVKLPTIAVQVVDCPIDREHLYDEIGRFVLPKFVIRASTSDHDKQYAKKLLAACDACLQEIGFIRTFGPTPEGDSEAFSLYSIYDANIVDTKKNRVYAR